MRVKIIGNSFSNEFESDVIPRIGELIKIRKAEHRVMDVHWRMKNTGVELSYAKVFLTP